MDPEVIEAIKANIRSIAEQGGTPAEIDAYLKVEGFNSREEWLAATDMRTPAIPEGTALGDFIATFGNAAALGIPRRLSSSLDERLDFLEENNPGTSALVGLGGAGLTGGAALRGGASLLARGTPAAQRQAAAAAARAARNRVTATEAFGGVASQLPTASGIRAAAQSAAQPSVLQRGLSTARTAKDGLMSLIGDSRFTGGALGASLLERLLRG